ncbi:hypothetical protein BQ8794_50526 [Mesorhizobium prunaredense]|uniref:Uncharacterized protein n=1 Tax=Mesorhizobium prunaredense TaxID=1631249 RepID=A0A1R3VF26_9HYPH|nr:hypothetical protein BQ8794_50526 [Mesorhizobium prunaredense]
MGFDLAQLHLRHDRQSQGRRLSPSRCGTDGLCQHHPCRHGQACGLSVDAADVPLQWLVLSVDAGRAGRHPCLPALGAAEADLRRHRRPRRHPSVRRAGGDVGADQRQRPGQAAISADGHLQHRRGTAAGSGAVGHGRCGFCRHPPLWPDRDLWPGGRQRMAGRVGWAGEGTEGGEEGQARCALCRARGSDGDGSRDDGGDAGRRRDDRRGHVPRQHRHEGLSEEPQGERRGLRRRLVPLGRPRRHASRRLHPAQGPLQGHHHFRRREHLLDRSRGGALQAYRRRLLRRGRQARRQMGRGAGRLCRAEAGQDGDRGRDHRSLPRAARPLQTAESGDLRRNPEDLNRQDPEVPAEGDGQGVAEQFQEKCAAVFRPELRKNKYLERVGDSIKS